MNANWLTAAALWTLSIGMVASAALGPLAFGVIRFPISTTMEHQLVGGEIASLVLAAPFAALAGGLWWRGHRLAPVMAFGPASYATYMYVQYVVGPEYSRYEGNSERAFPLYLALFLLGWTLAARSWVALGELRLPGMPSRLSVALGSLLLISNLIFLLAWIASLAEVYGGNPTIEYQRDPQLFWLIRMLDLGLVIPVGVTVGIGLLRSARWARLPGYAVMGFQTLIVAAVAGMAVRMEWMDDPSSDPVLLTVTVVLAAIFLLAGAMLVRAAGRPSAESRRPGTSTMGHSISP